MCMKISFKVKTKSDTKVWDKMVRNLKRGSHHTNQVGFFRGRNEGIPVAQIAMWQEEGTIHIPRRSFIRLGFMKEIASSGIIQRHIPLIDKIAKGTLTWKRLNEMMSKEFVTLMQKQIIQWKSPPNSYSTVMKKGFNDPLIETGLMFDTVEARVVRRGSR